MREWWKRTQEIPYDSKEFQKILDYFLFNCPVEIKEKCNTYKRVSQRGKTLKQLNWNKSSLRTLLSEMKHTDSGILKYEQLSDSNDEWENKEKNYADTFNDEHFEMILFVKHPNMSITSSIFYYIRNALAHGSFSKVGETYYFECYKGKKRKARIRLREKTLLNWIELVHKTVSEVKELKKERTKKRKS